MRRNIQSNVKQGFFVLVYGGTPNDSLIASVTTNELDITDECILLKKNSCTNQ